MNWWKCLVQSIKTLSSILWNESCALECNKIGHIWLNISSGLPGLTQNIHPKIHTKRNHPETLPENPFETIWEPCGHSLFHRRNVSLIQVKCIFHLRQNSISWWTAYFILQYVQCTVWIESLILNIMVIYCNNPNISYSIQPLKPYWSERNSLKMIH